MSAFNLQNIQYREKEVFRIPQHHYCNKRVGIDKPVWSLAGLYSDLPLTFTLTYCDFHDQLFVQ